MQEHKVFSKVIAKYDGNYYELELSQLDVPSENPTDNHIKNAVAAEIENRSGTRPNFASYVVYPSENERNSGLHNDKEILNISPVAQLG